MRTVDDHNGPPRVPLWIGRPRALDVGAHAVAGAVFVGQLIVAIVSGAGVVTVLAVVAAGAAVVIKPLYRSAIRATFACEWQAFCNLRNARTNAFHAFPTAA